MKIERSVRDHYRSLMDIYNPISEEVSSLLKGACEKNGWIYSSRIKEEDSYALKLATGREVDDFFGCSIVVPSLQHVADAVTLVDSCVAIIDRRPKDVIRHRPTEFSFDSVRLYCQLIDSVKPTPMHGKKFEVQVKTLLEQAWSQATHDFSYKGGDISWAKERLAAQLKAMLDNVELSISQITTLSSSAVLGRTHEGYENKAKLLAYLRDELGKRGGVLMPTDIRRLTDIVHDLLEFMTADIADLQRWIENETVAGRGTNSTNFSAYSLILQSALNQDLKRFCSGLKSKSRHKVFLPSEVVVPAGIDLKNNRKIVRIA